MQTLRNQLATFDTERNEWTTYRTKWESEVSEYENRISALNQQLDGKEGELRNIKSEWEGRITTLETDLKKATELATDSRNEYEDLLTRYRRIDEKYKSTDESMTRYKTQITTLQGNIGEVTGERDSAYGEIQKLRAELERLRLAAATPKRKKEDGPMLFNKRPKGKIDDLKRIKGVGPKLEKLLHKNGVYYFWQVASWSDDEVEYVDAKLEVFKGRISRDEWVLQAGDLAALPDTANAPAEYSKESILRVN